MKKKAKYHIYLVTTKGCKGCEIQERHIKEALKIVQADIELHVSDYTKFKHSDKKLDKFRDFPTTIYYSDGEVLARTVGSEPTPIICNNIYSSFHVHPPKYIDDVTE